MGRKTEMTPERRGRSRRNIDMEFLGNQLFKSTRVRQTLFNSIMILQHCEIIAGLRGGAPDKIRHGRMDGILEMIRS